MSIAKSIRTIGDGRTTATFRERVQRGWAYFRDKSCGCRGSIMCARHFEQFNAWLDDDSRETHD